MLIVGCTRSQLVSKLPKGGCVAEIGVFQGSFSEQIMRLSEPSLLHLIDPWESEGDKNPQYTTSEMGLAFEHVRDIFRNEIDANRVVLHRKYSTVAAPSFPDHQFDWIYLDAVHSYENVLADLLAFKNKVKTDGFIFGHDFSNYRNAPLFGVIPAVREFVSSGEFELVLVTNETNPSFLLAHSENRTTLASLKEALFSKETHSIIEVDESLLDTLRQVPVTYADGRKGRIMRFG